MCDMLENSTLRAITVRVIYGKPDRYYTVEKNRPGRDYVSMDDKKRVKNKPNHYDMRLQNMIPNRDYIS